MNKKLSLEYPSLAKQWHPTKNENHSFDDFTKASRFNAWWKCPKGSDHEWQATFANRTKGTGCPFCRGLKVSKTNSLEALHPDIAKEWHPTKNENLKPSDIVSGSSKKYWWKCPKGQDHEWQASPENRIKGRGCPFCRGLKVSKTNSLEALHPDIAKEWHPTKNENLKPSNIVSGSSKKYWWKCPKGSDHEWQATPASRSGSRKTGCPYCRNLKVSITNSLFDNYPELVKEWHPTKNSSSPKDFVYGSKKKVWWKCLKKGHVWETLIYLRTLNKYGCPYCSGQRIDQDSSVLKSNPNLEEELHPTKNSNLDLSNETEKSQKKFWWSCREFEEHHWESSVKNKLKNPKCPICSGKVPSKSHSFATEFPDIAMEWHPNLNQLSPENFTPKSGQKAWWLCSKDSRHAWYTSIYSRTGNNKSGCPYCSGNKFLEEDSFGNKFPELAKEWHPEKNKVSPNQVAPKTSKKYWWKCAEGPDHEWQASCSDRGSGKGCPFCAGKKLSVTNSIETLYPEIAKEWHPTKNKVKPAQVLSGTRKKYWWKCPEGPDHEWEKSPSDRTSGRKAGCPYCRGFRASITNSLKFNFPELAQQWDFEKNAPLIPEDIVSGSHKKYWWKCSKGEDHNWRATVLDRTKGPGCPFCNNKLLSKTNSLLNYPELVKEFHPTKNGQLKPEKVIAASTKKLWWKCPEAPDHEWEISPRSRSGNKKTGCPFCRGLKVSDSNSLSNNYPELSKEWHPIKNKELTPQDVVYGYGKNVWWKCSKNTEHEWQASPSQRTRVNTGCPHCNYKGWTVDKIRYFIKSILEHLETFTAAELYTAFMQSGLLKTEGKGRAFVKALVTGRFPHNEVEKFVQGEPSLVDEFVEDPKLTLEQHEINQQSNDGLEIEPEAVVLENDIDESEQDLPIVKTKEVLNSLNHELISTADGEAIDFYIASALSKIWKHAFANEKEAVSEAKSFKGDTYAEEVRSKFLEQYDGAKSLTIPDGYAFKYQPNLMQRLAAYKVQTEQRVGNWSGTGAGKTLSAILASRVIGSEFTIICCPNSVVEGWKRNIQEIYPDSEVVCKTWTPKWKSENLKYLVLNFEAFQQSDTAKKLKALLKKQTPEFIVIDEIHYAKQRHSEQMSMRKKHVLALITESGKENEDLNVLGMSATPVINNLQEGKSLIELISGIEHDELETKPTLPNCIRLHQKLVTMGLRWLPNYEYIFEQIEHPVDCSEYLVDIKALGKNGNPLALESILTQARLPVIREQIKPKTLIYTHYIQGIDKILYDALTEDGWSVGFYTGDDKSGLDAFVDGSLDVLIGSSAISTGVDRLQEVCNRLIINVLPWTHAEYLQLKGRIYRQGQKQDKVEVIVPVTYAEFSDQRWSWCESKLQRLKFKKSIADAAVDGVVPEGHLRTPAQAYQDVMNWLERVESGELNVITRQKIVVPLPESDEQDVQRRVRSYGDFSQMNNRWNRTESSKTHERLKQNPEEWMEYHTQYRKARENWTVVPYEELIKWFEKREGYHIADFGCGEAKIADALKDKHTVYSFDHVAINDDVIACDMKNVPLEDEVLDAAIFSLSLMGNNFAEYIQEAHRCLKLDGQLHIIEATSRFCNRELFCNQLKKFGFDLIALKDLWKFTHIRLLKIEEAMNNEVDIEF